MCWNLSLFQFVLLRFRSFPIYSYCFGCFACFSWQSRRFRSWVKPVFLLLAHLELCSRSAYAVACYPSSVRRPSVVNRSHFWLSWTVSRIEVKLSGRHCGNMEIQNCWNHSVPISKMAAMAAILKFFKRHLPNCKSDWVKTWWEASQWHKDSELLKQLPKQWDRDSKLLKSFRSSIQDGCHGGHLEILQTTSPPKVGYAKIWWGVSQWHKDSELLKSFRSDIQDGCRGSHLEILQTTTPPKP